MGGTGPSVVTPVGGGRRVGGEETGMLSLEVPWTLCDREDEGGGPGGGGGSGIPGSHLDWDADRERADVGVVIAPVEAARRAAGGPGCAIAIGEKRVRSTSGVCEGPGAGSCLESGEEWCGPGEIGVCSGSLRRLREGKPNLRSRDGPRPRAPGGGGKEGLAGWSGEGRRTFVGSARGPGEAVEADAGDCSKTPLTGRDCWLLGGLYGGGGGGREDAGKRR